MPHSDYLLLESIKVSEKQIHNLEYHQDRILRSSKEIFGAAVRIDFEPIMDEIIALPSILFKLRLTYNDSFFKYEFVPYKLPTINTLKLIKSNGIDYTHKYNNRNMLSKLFRRRQHYDDILIVKHGFLSDSYYCNLAFSQHGIWYTPSTPLLKGTKRQALLDQKQIIEKPIPSSKLSEYKSVSLINAMIDLEEIMVPISQVF